MKFYIIYLFIHSGFFYSASSGPLLVRGAPDTARILSEFHAEAPQATASEGLAQGPYVVAREGFEIMTVKNSAMHTPLTSI